MAFLFVLDLLQFLPQCLVILSSEHLLKLSRVDVDSEPLLFDLVESHVLIELLQSLGFLLLWRDCLVFAERILNELSKVKFCKQLWFMLVLEELHSVEYGLSSLFLFSIFLVEAAEHQVSAVGAEFQD